MSETAIAVSSIVLAVGAVLIPSLGLWQRKANKGIGSQFIRFTVIGSALPIAGLLLLNGVFTGEAAAVFGAALGYAFGRSDEGQANASGAKGSEAKGSEAAQRAEN